MSRAGQDKAKQGMAGQGQGRTKQGTVMLSIKPHLGYFSVEALTHFNPSMCDQHSAICVDMHQSPSLVQELGGEGDAKLGGDDSQTSLPPPVSLVELITCLLPLGKSCLADDTIPAGLRTTP